MDLGQYQAIQSDPFVGQVFEERYRIDDVLGKGGFGAVYRAEQLAVGRTVAIKLLHAHHADDLKETTRFQREARAIAALRHPNIVQVHDFGQTQDGFLYLVMEHLEGRTFQDIVRDEAPIEPDRLIDYLIQALDGLAEAHSRGIIHRDLKPENVFCATIGRRSDVIKLLDFGIAKIIDETGALKTLTGKGMAVGSPRYMSPEQAKAQSVSERTDLYLIGLIAYELLTGGAVFERSSPTSYLLAHIEDLPAPPAVDGVELTGPLVDLILQCLLKRPEDRPESAEALMRALQACRGSALDEVGVVTAAETPGIEEGPGMPTPPGQFRVPDLSTFRAAAESREKSRRLRPKIKPPLPPTVLDRPAAPGPASPSGARLKVFLSVFLFVLIVGGGLVAFWMYKQAVVSERTQGTEVTGEPSTDDPRTPTSREGPQAPETRCKATSDCAPALTCIDGRCEALD